MKKITASVVPICSVPPDEAKDFISWVWGARTINCFDPDVLSYPRSCMTKAEDGDGATLYIPIQPVLMFESIAPRPGISPKKEALSLLRIDELLEDVARDTGIMEQYFLCKDDRVADLCRGHGFTEMEGYRILKKKISARKPEEGPKAE